MNEGIGQRIRGSYQTTSRFFGQRIWEQRIDDLPSRRAYLYLASRILHCTVKGLLFGDTLHVRAAALTYYTVLSLVPLMAFAFALLKGFGAYDVLIEESIRPYVLELLSGNQALQTVFDKILGFVDDTGVTSLGFVGLLFLLYAATRLLSNVEGALNEVFGAKSGRELLQQLRDYVSIIVITPLCMMAAAALTTLGQALDLLRAAGNSLGISGFVDPLISLLGPLSVLFLGLLFLYKVMPYTKVRMLSAVVGAVVGALLWYLVLIAHVRFQVGVARFNALYSSFGAIPIFLAWLQVSWLVVLVGAQVAATHQNGRTLAQHRRMAEADQAAKEAICLAVALRIARTFMAGDKPITLTALSTELDVAEPLLQELLESLVQSSVAVRVTDAGTSSAFVLARPAQQIFVKDVLDALRRSPAPPEDSYVQRTQVGGAATELWLELDRAIAQSPANRSLQEVVEGHAEAEDAPNSPQEVVEGHAEAEDAPNSPQAAHAGDDRA